MLRLLPLLVLLVASQAQAQTLTLTYARASRGLSDATLTLDRNARSADTVSILSDGGTVVHITDFESGRDGLSARAKLPPAEDIAIIFIGEGRGRTTAWNIQAGPEGYIWVEEGPQIFDQTGQRVASEDELIAIRRMLNSGRRVQDRKDPREVRVSRQRLVIVF